MTKKIFYVKFSYNKKNVLYFCISIKRTVRVNIFIEKSICNIPFI